MFAREWPPAFSGARQITWRNDRLRCSAGVGRNLSVAVACLAGGLLIERLLFFAEATHTVTLYYGADKA